MHIVVLAPSAGFDEGSLPGLPDGARVTLIAGEQAVESHAETVVLPRQGGLAARLRALASRSMPGRVLIRLTPLDAGATFWRATRSAPSARATIRTADVLVAAERDAAYAAWRWARAARQAGRDLPTVYGYPAARAAVERLAR